MESKNEEQSSSWSAGLSEEAIAFTIPTVMVKLLATIDPDGYPHITLIVSNQAVSKDFIKWGQFTVGMSKRNVAANPKQGAYYMTIFPPYRFMQAKMTLDHCSTEGADAADLNDAFLFRYNTYVRIYKVYFNKVVAASPIKDLMPGGIFKGIIANAIGKGGMKTGHVEERLPLYGVQLFSGPIIPKFACYVDADGYPVIFPCFQARAIERKQIVFPLTQFKDELLKFKKADKLAFLAIDTESRSLLVKGTFLGFKKSRGITYGQVDIDQVYNSMPPTPGLVYPALEVRPKIEKFAL